MGVYRRQWRQPQRRHSPWVGTKAGGVSVSVPSGVINLSGDAALFTLPPGVISISGDACTAKHVANPTSGVITWSADAVTTTFKANPPSGVISVSAGAPTVTDTEAVPSGVINLSADAPSFTDFSVVLTTNLGGAGPTPSPKRRPQQVIAFKPERARVLALALVPRFQIELAPVPARIGATAGRASTSVALRSTVAAGRMTMTATPDPTIQQELEDRIRRVLVAIES